MLFFAAVRPIGKTKENIRKQKKTYFFLFLFCLLPAGQWEKFLTVFLICTFVQNYNHTGRNISWENKAKWPSKNKPNNQVKTSQMTKQNQFFLLYFSKILIFYHVIFRLKFLACQVHVIALEKITFKVLAVGFFIVSTSVYSKLINELRNDEKKHLKTCFFRKKSTWKLYFLQKKSTLRCFFLRENSISKCFFVFDLPMTS